MHIFIVATLQNETIVRVLVKVFVCVHMCVCVSVCVFLHDNWKRNGSRNMKFKCIVVNENNFNSYIGQCRTKVKVKA